MRPYVATVLTLTLQLLLAVPLLNAVAWILARTRPRDRRRVAAWTRAGRDLLRAAPWALALGVSALGCRAWLADPAPPFVWERPIGALLAGAWATGGGYVLLVAARLEGRGRPRISRRQTRLGGLMLFSGTLLSLIVVWRSLVFDSAFRRAVLIDSPSAGVILLPAMVALCCAAFVGLLAGLTGKPRPSGYFAALLYVAGSTGVLAALAAAV